MCDLLNKESKIAVLKKLNEFQENTEDQFNEIQNTENKKFINKLYKTE